MSDEPLTRQSRRAKAGSAGKKVSRSAAIAAQRELAAPDAGRAIVQADLIGTAVLAAVSLITAVLPSNATEIATLIVSLVLLLGGCVAFAMGFFGAAERSRYEVLDLAGVYYLTGSAPEPIRQRMLRLWFAQIAIAAASAPFVHPPFAILAVLWGIGLNALWSSRHGAFPDRPGVPRA